MLKLEKNKEKNKTQNIIEQENNVLYKPESFWKITARKFVKNKLAVFGAIFILFLIIVALITPLIAPYSPDEQFLTDKLAPPGENYILGTDKLGRDTFSRLLYGARVSLLISFCAVAGQIVIGTTIGAIAGYFGGIIDAILMRLVDVLISIPTIFLLISLVAILEPSLGILIFVFTLFGWTGTARLVRGEFLSLRTREFVLAAQTMGVSRFKIIFSHILPNAIGPIIVSATLSLGGVILSEAALSYLGLGVQPPTPSWGNMLQDAQDFTIMLDAWWYPLFPGIMIFLTILAFNFIGDGLRDAFDPKMNR